LTLLFQPQPKETAMSIKGILKQAYETGDFVTITTNQSVYTEATVMSLTDEEVEINALHSIKDINYDFSIPFSTIETVEFE
jgi:hypothetical protein